MMDREHQCSVWPKDAVNLTQDARPISEVVQRKGAEREMKGRVTERQRLSEIGLHDRCTMPQLRPSGTNHARGDIQAHHART